MATLGGLGPCQAGAVSFARNRLKAARRIGALSFLPTKDHSKRSRPHTSIGTFLSIGAITREKRRPTLLQFRRLYFALSLDSGQSHRIAAVALDALELAAPLQDESAS